MFIELVENENEFYQNYIPSLAARSSCASSFLEEDSQNIQDIKTAIAISNHIQAFEYLFLRQKDALTPYDLPTLVSKMTGGAYDQFRKTKVEVKGSRWTRTEPRNIPIELYNLFDNYKIYGWL